MATRPLISQVDIPLCVPAIYGNEWKYVKECLDTNWVSYVGPFVGRFEEAVAKYVGTKYAVATVSGTAALHTALLVAGVESDDEVLVSTLTFISPANVIRYVGAWPVFIDAEPHYWQIDPDKIVDFLEKECRWSDGGLYNKVTGRRIKAVLPVHILGHPVDMTPILEVAGKYNLVVIEDAAESLGAKYKGKQVGHLGHIACFSFNGNKVATTGGGGMIVTDNESWARRAKYLTTQAKDDRLEYVHNEIGYNYRLTNIQAAMGVAQMEQLDSFVLKKRQIAAAYADGLGDLQGLSLMPEAKFAFSTYWLYTVLHNMADGERDSRHLISELHERGIQSRPLWMPAHRQERYEVCSFYGSGCADQLHRMALQLPSSVGITAQEIEYVITALRAACVK